MLIERTAHSGLLGFRPELSQVGAVVGLWCISCHGPQPWFELTIIDKENNNDHQHEGQYEHSP